MPRPQATQSLRLGGARTADSQGAGDAAKPGGGRHAWRLRRRLGDAGEPAPGRPGHQGQRAATTAARAASSAMRLRRMSASLRPPPTNSWWAGIQRIRGEHADRRTNNIHHALRRTQAIILRALSSRSDSTRARPSGIQDGVGLVQLLPAAGCPEEGTESHESPSHTPRVFCCHPSFTLWKPPLVHALVFPRCLGDCLLCYPSPSFQTEPLDQPSCRSRSGDLCRGTSKLDVLMNHRNCCSHRALVTSPYRRKSSFSSDYLGPLSNPSRLRSMAATAPIG